MSDFSQLGSSLKVEIIFALEASWYLGIMSGKFFFWKVKIVK